MSLSDISIKNPVFAWMLMIGIMLLGWIGFTRLPVDQFPNVDYPYITVNVTRQGASIYNMETQVVDIIEDAVMTIDGVVEVTSSSKQGSATITIEFDLKKDVDIAFQDVQAKISQVMKLLPADIDPPVIAKTNPTDQPIMWIALTGYRPPQELTDYVRDKLKPRLQTIPGVAEIMLGGFLERNIRIWLDPKKLQAYNLTVEDVINAIQKQHIELPAGRIENRYDEFNLRFKGEAINLEQLKKIIVAEYNTTQVHLDELAIIENGLEDVRRVARMNSLPAQGMGIKKMKNSSTVEVAKRVRAKLSEIEKTLPDDLRLFIAFDASQFIEDSIHEIVFSLLLAVIFTAIVTWLFLGSLSPTINVILAIPTSLLGTFLVMYFSDFTLNTFTLLALSLSIGIVVDDSIMVLENIYRHAEMGLERREASRIGANQITFAALAATIAVVAIFLPVAFMKGISGKFFFQFGVTLSVSVLFSYLEAITLTPARCSQILNIQERKNFIGRFVDEILALLKNIYAKILPYCLKWRYLVVIVSGLIFVFSLRIIGLLGKEMTPAQDQSRFLVRLQAQTGTSIEAMNQLVKQCEKIVSLIPEIDKYFAVIGGFGGGDVDTAIMFITMTPPKKRKITQQQMIQRIRKEFNAVPGLTAFVQDLSRSDPGRRTSFPIELALKGPDWDVLTELSSKLIEKMKASNIFSDIDTSYRIGMPETRIFPNRDRAADVGVSVASLGITVSALVGGVKVGQFEDRGRRFDVRVRLLRNERLKPQDIENLYVRAKNGYLISLQDLVKISTEPSLQSITRKNRERSITITANMAPNIAQADALNSVLKIAKEILPDGYSVEETGGSKTFRETFESLIFALFLGIAIAYMILASQFNSYIHPFTVLTALPFSATGALFALWLGNYTLNFLSIIGVLLLMGIVKKNSIILVDFTNQLREEGRSYRQALLEACPIRLRPILMTSVTTIVGAIPPVLALGPGAEFRVPMAISVIGGLSVSTLLTLFVVPAVYHIFEDFKYLLSKKKS